MPVTTPHLRRSLVASACGLALVAALAPSASPAPRAAGPAPGLAPQPAAAPAATSAAAKAGRVTKKNATARGSGGAVSSVDPEATHAGIEVLKKGGNAVDAAIATAAALGVTEPYSTGIGGGGYLVFYDAKAKKVRTIDGRETAPESIPTNAFLDPKTGKPYPFTPELVTSGVSVGVPGTPATWDTALRRWGTLSLRKALEPAEKIADRGFVVDETFREQTLQNKVRFAQVRSTRNLYLPKGDAPQVGSVFRNRDLAATYRALGEEGTDVIYRGRIGADIVDTVQSPPKTADATLPFPKGYLERSDLAAYRVERPKPTKVRYRGLDVYSIAPSSSGGSTVGEALNILGTKKLSEVPRTEALHDYLDASSLAFADRNAYVGDPAFVDVPLETLLSKRFARSRACLIGDRALPTPTQPGALDATGCAQAPAAGRNEVGTSTSHLVTSDRWGNVVSYTLTIEQTGGSGIVVPGRGFLLNNELTDFSYDPTVPDYAKDPNRIEGGKRPRSSMAPTIVLKKGKPKYAIGSPGGATIITTVLQTLVNRVDLGMTLPQAVAEPRASARNMASVSAEPEFIAEYGDALKALGYTLTPTGDSFTLNAQIGAVAALEFRKGGRVIAVAEPVRRGGGDAEVVRRR
ncbi:gamma-glutamyltransferase [Microlunatus flavus]|uniref:Glutathione hydrolase proenzyme n=1 Tax=Microlunatus flavus TaxID=1036181 RepID=A0A1H9ANT1_9ACTN|nr:gamma-glutamyltransferase [Microlunatus flavus]SEP78205.1 gamma-glutamyltranspeptidase / glutathione hydrolase [Microlunatus flavus]